MIGFFTLRMLENRGAYGLILKWAYPIWAFGKSLTWECRFDWTIFVVIQWRFNFTYPTNKLPSLLSFNIFDENNLIAKCLLNAKRTKTGKALQFGQLLRLSQKSVLSPNILFSVQNPTCGWQNECLYEHLSIHVFANRWQKRTLRKIRKSQYSYLCLNMQTVPQSQLQHSTVFINKDNRTFASNRWLTLFLNW